MRYKQQFDSSDCGAACLVMIASHFGMKLNIAKTRNITKTDIKGTSLYGISDGAQFYNLKSHVVKGSKSSINNKLYTPFITHVVNEGNFEHYVVVKKITKKKLYLGS